MFTEIFVVLGVIFLLSLLGYIVPMCIVKFSKPLDLKYRYGGGWAFITGGNSGIGEAFAYKTAKMGFNVAILGQNEERLNKTASAIQEINSQVLVQTIVADLSGDAVKVTEQIVHQLEGLDISILFFNAGYGVFELSSSPSANSLRQFRSNIVTHQYLFQTLYPQLAARRIDSEKEATKRGAVLFTASCAGFMQFPLMAVYGATKAYLGHLGECLATEADYYGIDVLSIYPGGVNTRFGERMNQKVSPMIEKVSQNGDNVADLALSSIGRVSRLDSGFQAVGLRIMTKIIDANLIIALMKKVAPQMIKKKKFDSNEKENQAQ
ncbi:MAG: putative short-chain dehydrogenase [Streblomastix strix]|uniref:Putative short-chain dehydrogenase n=1 Tax=Streblomastix strix TaxID=222440 RepID=A0A5J4WFT7_9EUKA|nr:MAG: putative short-chain dehydrogenase [Streblomastix strix]